MPKQIIQFKLLVVTPVDVSHEMHIIQEAVESINQMYGVINNADIKIQYWSFDNPKQKFSEFDAVIAVFWTQLGTSDKDSISNMKKEFELHMDSPDSIFLYFSECQASPLQTDSDRYKQILKFKSQYIKMSNCYTYNTLESFKRHVVNQLTLYFVEQLHTLQISSEPKMSDLKIMCVKEDQVVETPKLFKHRFIYSKFITNYKQKTYDLIHKINAYQLSQADSELKEMDENDSIEVENNSKDNLINNENLQKIAQTIRNLPNTNLVKSFLTEPAQISAEIQSVIIKYLETVDQKIEIAEFFNLGNLMERLNPLRNAQYGNIASSQLIGSEHEKEKYHLLMDLYAGIVIYEESYAYLSEVDALYYLHCVVTNMGNSYDEEIEVKLYFDKGYLCRRENLPVPGEGILDLMIPSVELFFKPRQVDTIEPFNAYPEDAMKLKKSFYGDHGLMRKQNTKDNHEIYRRRIETYFCYDYDQNDEFDVLSYHLSSIDLKTQITLPSYLVFKKEPRRLRYEISSKHSPEVIQRELRITRADG